MAKDYTKGVPDDVIKRALANGSDRYPKNIFVLYTTINNIGKTNEYLVRGDGELITEDKLPSLKEMLAFRQVKPNRRVEFIEEILFIPLQYRINFLEKESGKLIDETIRERFNLVTDPIMSKVILSEQEAREYLE